MLKGVLVEKAVTAEIALMLPVDDEGDNVCNASTKPGGYTTPAEQQFGYSTSEGQACHRR